MDDGRRVLAAVESELRRYKAMAEGVFAQLTDEQLVERASPESNSIAMLVWHVSGNLTSRFTDFLESDGEKPWRKRESEFEERRVGREEMLAKWERGWKVVTDALAELSDADLARTVRIRGEPHSVAQALLRAVAHASYHVGQMTYWGKILRGSSWSWLTIPPGASPPAPGEEPGPA